MRECNKDLKQGDGVTGKILYLDPWSGVSGDMLLASLLDTDRAGGALETALKNGVASLGLPAVSVEVVRDVEWGLACTRLRVREGEEVPPLRHLSDMERIIASASLSETVRRQAMEAVRRLADIEAAVHGCACEEIHFHEVGAVDTLVDIVGTFVLVEALGVERVGIGTIPVGGGTVEIAHGRMGVPAPATTRLLEGYEVVGGPEMRELTTPTGALLVGQLRAEQGPLPRMSVEAVGYGAGSMKLEHGPNVLRALVGREHAGEAEGGTDQVVELQTNLDDISPEVVGHVCGALRQAGVLDVWTVAADMKKNRPGVVLHALVAPSQEESAAGLIFRETGTLGLRRQAMTRRVAQRGSVEVAVAGGYLRVKWGRWQGQLVSLAPEYEDAAAVAEAAGLPLKDVMRLAVVAAGQRLNCGNSDWAAPGDAGRDE